ncbi:DNA polymerase alpha accessory factor Mcl1 [Coemansia aciculifera]|uniref:DNA polymerase alpha accessory factor Mcl1 n=1 Tax=Coemansia aciculifera TaxID=417176 RepID=A0A9W8M847_9FUNG|nr:DNA polymerase alpha accessory factor Mcl1 [Coemansia aciculifera]
MTQSITAPRYAHAEGYTALAFGKNGQFVCTGGSDSLVRVFYASKSERDQEAITLEQHSDNVLSLAVSRGKVISGDEEGMVFGFDLGQSSATESDGVSVEPSGTVLRSTLPARDISISSNERQVAIATDDESIRVVSLLDMALLHTLVGHRGSVNSVAYSPDSTYLASSGCDGTVRIWDMREGDPACVQIMPKIAYVCEPGNSMEQYKVRWSPDGRILAIPCADHSIKLIERNNWGVSALLAGRHTNTICHLAWSSNSKYLASASLDCQVVVWDVIARKAILSHANVNDLCQVEWNPRGNMLAFSDCTGAMYIWDDVIPVEQGHAAPFERALADAGSLSKDKLMSDLFDDTATANRASEDGMAEDEDEGDLLDAGDATADAMDDFVVDDDGAGYAERQAPRWTAVAASEVQCFQPGSTPWIGSRRYLAFTMVGSVVSIAQDESHNTIEIEFYDKSVHRDFHFSDSFKFSMAALSESGCLFATTSRELANDQSLRGAADADEVSVVSYKGFASWSANSDWTFKLPLKENPRCIATSSHGAAVITSLGNLRLFTCGGAQRHIETLPNRVVTCVARDDMLLIILEALGTIRSSGGMKQLEYEYVLMSMDGQSRLAAGSCPVTPASEIVWTGFSEEGHPAACDSKGMLRVLHKYWAPSHAGWVPVLDSRKLSRDRGKREGFWPVAISAKQFIVVTCQGKSKYPPFPKPILDELDIDVPLLNADTQVGQQEAKYLASRLFIEQQRGEAERTGSEYPGGVSMLARDELEQDKLLLRLIQLACKSDKTQRAMDLAMMIGLEKSFDAAVKIAVFLKQSSLAERLMRLRETKFASELDDDGDFSDESHSEAVSGQRDVLPNTRRPAAAATYGRERRPAGDDDDGDVDLSDGDSDLGVEALELGKSTRPPLPEALMRSGANTGAFADSASRGLVSRPAQPPTTSKPFNPFGVATPSKSMEIKRSDSFFNAADMHSDESAAGPSTPSKRQQPSLDDDDAAAGVPRKLAKKATKLTAFAFNKGGSSANDMADDD